MFDTGDNNHHSYVIKHAGSKGYGPDVMQHHMFDYGISGDVEPSCLTAIAESLWPLATPNHTPLPPAMSLSMQVSLWSMHVECDMV